jgi:hypothetical protein
VKPKATGAASSRPPSTKAICGLGTRSSKSAAAADPLRDAFHFRTAMRWISVISHVMTFAIALSLPLLSLMVPLSNRVLNLGVWEGSTGDEQHVS